MDPTPWPKNKNGSVSTAIEEKRDYQKTKLKLQSKTLTYITTPTIIIHRSLLHSRQYRSTKTQQNPNQSVDYNRHRYSKSTDAESIALNRLALPLSELDGHEKKPLRRRRKEGSTILQNAKSPKAAWTRNAHELTKTTQRPWVLNWSDTNLNPTQVWLLGNF